MMAMKTLPLFFSTVAIMLIPAFACAQQVPMAASGVKTRVNVHSAVNIDCEAEHLTARVTSPPSHGKVFIQNEKVLTATHNRNGGAQRCAGLKVQGIAIYYQSERGYTGQDSFTYIRLNADNANDRNNRDVTLTVTVR